MAKKPSVVWYLLPILFSLVGGIIGYLIFRKKNRKFAERLLIAGAMVLVIDIVLSLVVAGILAGWATQFAETQRETMALCVNAKMLLTRGTYSSGTLSLVAYNYGSVDLDSLKVTLTYPDGAVEAPGTFGIAAGDTKVFTVEGVGSDLENVAIESGLCPGTSDALRASEIEGLEA